MVPPTSRLPHVAKRMALATRFEDLRDTGQGRDRAELGRVSRARLTQIMNLLNSAPRIFRGKCCRTKAPPGSM